MPEAHYETHVTVRATDAERLSRHAADAGLKLTHILLARGRTASQLMVTPPGAASYAQEFANAQQVCESLRANGFDPVRVKIESTPWAPEVPMQPGDDGRYFENHVKLLLSPDTDLAELAEVAEPHGAHVSWNARRARRGGRHERFVTQRCWRMDAVGAHAALGRLLGDLAGEDVLEVEEEFVLYDSDLSLDDGWIKELRS